ncbi:transcription antitermination factor NusB [Lapidilactobacillus gannanensis]|jgi:N utilization substance protein B|uniref:Transcription antitermination protein NusB n=1 Tax=Lapidilactobacillus gannanensis TaxID=2486002 RepID=A0ABW4BQA3_9LACO|nr:transcription antitermination factor NusB [Lapidilactobacillus gannanensis]MCH4058141.1 transcription antitermination factor NusB [Lactobacillaceae bacterium]
MLDRHQTRKLAFQALFMLASNPDLSIPRALQIVLAIQENHQDDDQTPVVLDKSDPNQVYLETLVTEVSAKQTELDQALTPKLKKGWTLARLSRTDLILLRIGLDEIQNQPTIPNAVAINEAIQLAKEFSDANAEKFINGVLASFLPAATK